MMNFLRNHFYRIKNKKYFVLIAAAMTILSIVLAVYFNTKAVDNINVAVVSNSKTVAFQSRYVKFFYLKNKPQKYQLVIGKYDGVLIDKGEGKYKVETIKGKDSQKMLEKIVKKPKGFSPEKGEKRGLGASIIGYLMMSILLQCSIFMFTLSDEIELKQIERIAAAPVSFVKYLLSHFICSFVTIFTPAFLSLVFMKVVLKYNIGFSLTKYAVLLGILCAFGIAFAMFITAMVKVADTANMICSAVLLMTTILSGSFYSFEKGNDIMQKAVWLLPQKSFLSFVTGIENRRSVFTMTVQISYVIIITILCILIASLKIKKDYVLKED